MPSPILIDVELPEVLTASICSYLAIEFFKHIAYQRQQLPFPFKQLKSVLSRRDSCKSQEEQVSEGCIPRNAFRSCQAIQAENEYRKVKCIFESFQATFESLEKELCFEGGCVEEIAMIIGATPLSPRDVYRIQFPRLLYGHLDSKHPHQNSLLQMFRSLISSEDLHSVFSQPMLPTNMFLFVRKSSPQVVTSGFAPKERYNIPKSGKHAIIRLIPPASIPKCICGGKNIFRDAETDTESSSVSSVNFNQTEVAGDTMSHWFQAHNTLKGFKDLKINGISASTVWLQSR